MPKINNLQSLAHGPVGNSRQLRRGPAWTLQRIKGELRAGGFRRLRGGPAGLNEAHTGTLGSAGSRGTNRNGHRRGRWHVNSHRSVHLSDRALHLTSLPCRLNPLLSISLCNVTPRPTRVSDARGAETCTGEHGAGNGAGGAFLRLPCRRLQRVRVQHQELEGTHILRPRVGN